MPEEVDVIIGPGGERQPKDPAPTPGEDIADELDDGTQPVNDGPVGPPKSEDPIVVPGGTPGVVKSDLEVRLDAIEEVLREISRQQEILDLLERIEITLAEVRAIAEE